MTAHEIVQDDHALAGRAQEFYRDAADVSGTSRDENRHQPSFQSEFVDRLRECSRALLYYAGC
jgi:hypothetical protein